MNEPYATTMEDKYGDVLSEFLSALSIIKGLSGKDHMKLIKLHERFGGFKSVISNAQRLSDAVKSFEEKQ